MRICANVCFLRFQTVAFKKNVRAVNNLPSLQCFMPFLSIPLQKTVQRRSVSFNVMLQGRFSEKVWNNTIQRYTMGAI